MKRGGKESFIKSNKKIIISQSRSFEALNKIRWRGQNKSLHVDLITSYIRMQIKRSERQNTQKAYTFGVQHPTSKPINEKNSIESDKRALIKFNDKLLFKHFKRY
jgi:hypothetical protein